jgi:poly(A)-specific ribonuclease
MDIDRFNFRHTLPVVLEAISLSDYVAFDLVMTGVTSHSSNKTPAYTQATAYRLAFEAATTFQILQIGLTCLFYDHKQNDLYNYAQISLRGVVNIRQGTA